MAVDEDKLNAFLGKAVGDLGAAMSAVQILVGDELGLYSALAEGRLTSANWLNVRARANDMCANGSPIRPPADTSNTTATARSTS